MYPHERSLVKQLAGKPFALIGVNSDDDLEGIRKTVKKKNLTWRSFQNEKGKDGKISDQWGIQGWPTIFILDAKGTIRWKGSSPNFDKVIEKCLAEIGHEVKIKHGDHDDDSHNDNGHDKNSHDGDDHKDHSHDADHKHSHDGHSHDGDDHKGGDNKEGKAKSKKEKGKKSDK